MIDAALLPPLRAVLNVPARALLARGVGADQVTIAGFCIGLLALPALWLGSYWVALALILTNRFADGLDGVMARKVDPTDRGAFLDIALDFFFYATVPLGFALADQGNALAAAVLICAFIGTGSSFLAFAVIAAKRGLQAQDYPTKGIYYLGGITEGAETISVFVLMCLFPAWFVPLALGFAMACFFTTLLRWLQGWRAFSEQ
ncbi:CDP-alcohol phosphatidyltransferase family protein [Pseudorhodobacter turbinis]|uniref:CDP-alcohol phosphatidyltransferase family protein n=1 Tax=Pseudorhodobacter turbinis TaxID=2500533 RepID=A0A4P8EFK3_9RHOB|nr:CDP-alcohol phosphatidyltransferase family protein [Pseudorhodobacter turbinis]QCO55891.1 CDP-alcohol phosphatidyltransferase family protein [Pseudorhodobacter turbinis]